MWRHIVSKTAVRGTQLKLHNTSPNSISTYNFDIGLQSIGTDSESETKEGLTDFSMKKNNFTAMLE
jgi:hypothetical protein